MRCRVRFIMLKFVSRIKSKKSDVIRPKTKKGDLIITIYFGPPGVGKSCMAALIARKCLKRKQTVYSNLPITGCRILDPKADLGVFDTVDAKILIDEASVVFNNRRFKDMPQHVIEYLKYHRHHLDSIDFFSQSWDDIDITIRRLAQKLYLIKKTFLPWFIILVPIKQSFGPSQDESEIIFKYQFAKWFNWKVRFTPPAWKMFNTLARPKLPDKDWQTY